MLNGKIYIGAVVNIIKMTDPITAVKQYIGDKIDAWQYKNDLDLCSDNPILFDLKWTGEHFRDLYRIAKEKGIKEAWGYEKIVTQMRSEDRKKEREIRLKEAELMRALRLLR